MVDYARTRAVMRAAEGRLLLHPGVHAVGVGQKITGGQRTDEPAIIVFLVKKRPLSELAPEEVVPPEIDGVKTDVIEMSVPKVGFSIPNPVVDDSRKRPLVGGTCVQASVHEIVQTIVQGGVQTRDKIFVGTLGCFAHTNDPQPKVVAITSQHVVDPRVGRFKSSVTVTVPPGPPGSNPYTISFSIQPPPAGQQPVTTGSLVLVMMANSAMVDQRKSNKYNAWWRVTAADTAAADTAAAIAGHIKDQVNKITGAGVSAAFGQHPTDVVITADPGSTTRVAGCTVYDPPIYLSDADLSASIAGNVITLSGKVSGDYAVYVTWNTDSGDPSGGVLTPLSKGTSLADAAAAIVGSITKVGGVTASNTPTTVTVNGAAMVDCDILDNQQVGQPNDSFSSDCCCCANEMGRVFAADLSLDTALIQVRRGTQYLNEVLAGNSPTGQNTVITGVGAVGATDVDAQEDFYKRGIRTNYTTGIPIALGVNGYITNGAENEPWTVFHRFYQNAITFRGAPAETPFSGEGDSGAAVFDDTGAVVGTVFGGAKDDTTGNHYSFVTPIEQITTRMKIIVETSPEANQVETVTTAEGAPAVVVADDGALLTQVLTTQAQVTSTPDGKRYAQLITRHAREVQSLINDNRRVTVAWHRNGGPQIVRAALQYLGQPSQRLPQEIDGLPLAERLSRIGGALARYGSAELASDLGKYGAELLDLTSLSLDEALDQLRASELAEADAD
jgi:hypothetical protein